MKAAQLLDAPTVMDCLLEAAAMGFTNISEKTKNIEKIGFPGRIRPK